MTKFIVGFICGLVVATVGFQGVALLADQGVKAAQASLTDQVKNAKDVPLR